MKEKNSLKFNDPVNFATISPDGNLLACCGDCLPISITDMRTGKLVSYLMGHDDFGFSLAWHPS